MIVVDTNLLVYLLVQGARTKAAEAAYQRDSEWVAPPLWRSEFRNTIALYRRRGLLSVGEVFAAIARAEIVIRKDVPVRSADVLHLTLASRCSAYDCEFVAVAREIGVPLVTADRQILAEFPAIAVSLDAFAA